MRSGNMNRDTPFLVADTKEQGADPEKCDGQITHDDEDLFKERLKNMGKGAIHYRYIHCVESEMSRKIMLFYRYF